MKQLSPSQPHLIVLIGIPGSGKTFFAEKFSDTFHAPYVSRDLIAQMAGEDAADAITTYQLEELLKTGQSVVYDGMSDTRASRLELAKKARAAHYEVLLVWVQTDEATARSRAAKYGFDDDSYDKRVKRFTPPTPPEKPVVISGKHTYASQAKAILQRLSAPRAEISAHTKPPARQEPPRRNITIR